MPINLRSCLVDWAGDEIEAINGIRISGNETDVLSWVYFRAGFNRPRGGASIIQTFLVFLPQNTPAAPSGPEISMDAIVFNTVSKAFRHRPALFNWVGREREGCTEALRAVSLRLSIGGVLVLLGPNGSGKTTALKLISTMLIPDAGSVSVCGSDTLYDGDTVRCKVGFAMAHERTFFPRLTARENLDFFATLENVSKKERGARVGEKLERTGLTAAADTLVMKFSTGMYQRLGVARALLKNPEVLLLDEPTRSLDPGSAMHFWDFVRELPAARTTVIVATHNFQEAAAVGDHVAVLQSGALAAQRPITPGSSVDAMRAFYFDAVGEPELRAATSAPPSREIP